MSPCDLFIAEVSYYKSKRPAVKARQGLSKQLNEMKEFAKFANTFSVGLILISRILGLMQPQAGIRERLRRSDCLRL